MNGTKQKWFCTILRKPTEFNLFILQKRENIWLHHTPNKEINIKTENFKLIKHTELRVKEANGTPSIVFQILAEPSVDVEAKNSESRLGVGQK